jgi:hypothetical protein
MLVITSATRPGRHVPIHPVQGIAPPAIVIQSKALSFLLAAFACSWDMTSPPPACPAFFDDAVMPQSPHEAAWCMVVVDVHGMFM